MGQFSWLSVDTDEQIFNDKPAGYQTVTMVYKDKNGVIKRAVETDYEGYGVFEGVDFYVALAWMNNITVDSDDEDKLRSAAIDFYYDGGSDKEYPQLFLSTPPADNHIDFTVVPEDDPNQGWSHQEPDYDYDEFDTYLGWDDHEDWDDDEDEWDDEDEDDDDEEDED